MVLFLFLTENKLICAHTSLFLFLARLLLQINTIIVNDSVSLFGTWFPQLNWYSLSKLLCK